MEQFEVALITGLLNCRCVWILLQFLKPGASALCSWHLIWTTFRENPAASDINDRSTSYPLLWQGSKPLLQMCVPKGDIEIPSPGMSAVQRWKEEAQNGSRNGTTKPCDFWLPISRFRDRQGVILWYLTDDRRGVVLPTSGGLRT